MPKSGAAGDAVCHFLSLVDRRKSGYSFQVQVRKRKLQKPFYGIKVACMLV